LNNVAEVFSSLAEKSGSCILYNCVNCTERGGTTLWRGVSVAACICVCICGYLFT